MQTLYEAKQSMKNTCTLMEIYLPVDHIHPPDHKLDNPVGGWPVGTPSHPLCVK